MRRFIAPLAVTLFALFAAQPLFVRQLTCSDDSAFHIHRAVALEQLIDSGHFFERWSPHMAQGFGYPFFNYYGPLSTYLLVGLHKLGLIYPEAFHLFLALCLWLAGLAVLAFVREWWGDAAGVASAVCYLSAPYFGYDILFRGVLAETFALVWPPLILLTLHRALSRPPAAGEGLVESGGVRAVHHLYSLLAAAAFAALTYTHNTTALMVAPLAAGYILLLAVAQRDWRILARGGGVIVLGLALSARFWLPALAERDLVQPDRLLVPPIFTYYTNFISPRELLAPPSAIDPLLINPSPARAVGLLAGLLALLGFAALAVGASPLARSLFRERAASVRPRDTYFGIWLLGSGIFFALLTLPVSEPFWRSVPLLPFIQFPWRFVGPASLCAAALAGACVHWVPRRQWLIAGAIASVVALGNLSWWYPRYCAPFEEADLTRLLQYERSTATVGTTAKGEYLPKTVKALPDDDAIAEALMRGETPPYLSGLPQGAQVEVRVPDPLDYEAAVSLPAPAQLTFNQFYFPGWRALVDEKPAGISPTPDTGLITLAAPSGTHTLRFHFGSTPIRSLGDVISMVTILGVLAYGAWWIAHRGRRAGSCSSESRLAEPPPFAFLFLPFLLLVARPLLLDRTTHLLRHSAYDGSAVDAGQPIEVDLAGGLRVLSVEYPPSISSGSEFDVTLYLTSRERTDREYRPRFDVVSGDGLTWNYGNDALPPRWHREPPETPYWALGQYAQWARRQSLLPGTPPGDYQLTVTVFDRASLAPDSIVNENGTPVSPVTALGTLHVARPDAPPPVSDLDIQHRVDHDLGPFTLLGYNLDRAEARPGDSVLVTLFFRADEATHADHRFNLLHPSYPTSEWQPGDLWRFQALARIPASAPSGLFRFRLTCLTLPASDFALQPITLTAPERIFDRPEVATPVSIRFGDSIELAGYELQPANNQLQLTLLWHALSETPEDLVAFVHVEDSLGRIVAQSDAVPANWSRPTTGWVAGEYLLDARTLPQLPAGEYGLFVGLADRLTGARLVTQSGDRASLGVYKAP